eukprot:9469800-Pyramimonas_sp.AAC.1
MRSSGAPPAPPAVAPPVDATGASREADDARLRCAQPPAHRASGLPGVKYTLDLGYRGGHIPGDKCGAKEGAGSPTSGQPVCSQIATPPASACR